MVLKVCATLAATIALVLSPLPPRAAAEAGAPVLTQIGGVLCSVSADDVPRGGGPMVTCQRSDGKPFAQAPFSVTKPWPMLNLAVVRGTGQFTWELGNIAGPPPVNLVAGQTYHFNGWTIKAGETRSDITYDATSHGMFIGPDFVHALWI
jgi:nitrate reductase NapE component